MAFQSLYRKYRPQRFDELVGQEHVTTALRNAVREGRVGHAYLFSGPRGTGKTTTGRILAKALNCLHLGEDGEPDGTCENCVAIAAGSFNDLVEMDAASNNGVDAIRDLVERVSLGIGATSKVKVYLIDEVHMLSNAASNALLKTLEEPPGHVVFVLATTNPEKVLPTIRSRTQHFELTLLSMDEITGLLASLLEREGVEFEPEALTPIARAAARLRPGRRVAARPGARPRRRARSPRPEWTPCSAVHRSTPASRSSMRSERKTSPARSTGLATLLESGHDARRIAEDLLRSLRDAFLLVAARGEVHVDAPEDERERLQSIGDVLGNAAARCAASRRSGKPSSTCAARTRPTRASCWRSRSCGSPGARPAARSRSSPTGSSGSSSASPTDRSPHRQRTCAARCRARAPKPTARAGAGRASRAGR